MNNHTGQEPDDLEDDDDIDAQHQDAVLMNEIMATAAFAIVVLLLCAAYHLAA